MQILPIRKEEQHGDQQKNGPSPCGLMRQQGANRWKCPAQDYQQYAETPLLPDEESSYAHHDASRDVRHDEQETTSG